MAKQAIWAVFFGVMFGCGVSQGTVGDEADVLGDDSAELSTTRDTFVIARRDMRRCVSPMCGGYWVRDLNSTMQDRYVSAFDFAGSGLSDEAQQALTGAPDNEVVLFGRLGPKETRFNTRTLVVQRGFRAMPGRSFSEGAKFYSVFPTKIACVTQPCANLQASRVNRLTGHVMATDLDVSEALPSFGDADWLYSRALYGKAIVAGNVERKNGHITVVATQVFVELPDRVAACEKPRTVSCGPNRIPAFDRTSDRCLVNAGCTAIGVCPQFFPNCEAGYRMVSWVNICPRYACEPEFLEP